MLVNPQDLRELKDPSGARYQNFITALVMNEALQSGLNPTDIHADYRTNYADGGCDIFVSKGQSKSSTSLIPDKPSIWSIKEGQNGINAAKFAEEFNAKQHPRLLNHLRNGHVYVWCALQPAGQNERQAMQDKAESIAASLGIDSDLIRFVWNDHQCEVLNRHLNLIVKHLPHLFSVVKPMMTLGQWKNESPDRRGLQIPFVVLPGNIDLQAQISAHLLGNSNDAVFHVAGLSGIGKTRLAFETCLTHGELSNTLYIGAFSQINRELWLRLSEPGINVRLIIDEVPLEEVTRLQSRFADSGDRIRIVSIGPAPRGQTRRQRDHMLRQLEPPGEITGVLPVVNVAAPDIAEDVRRSIAHFCGHDLRLAVLLIDATRKSGQFSTAPLRDYEDVWQRIMVLFSSQIKNRDSFRELYEMLTLAVDIGISGDHRPELRLLALHFNQKEGDFDKAMNLANECGLGDRLQSFFEAKPRALAVWLFQEALWPLLGPRLEEFVNAKPSPRLLRRFLERCQETSSPFREEVESRLGDFFFHFLGDPVLTSLVGREASRIFQAWAEFDPVRGLAWLESAVTHASDTDLKQFTGDTDGSGGWGGRRQIVWLCEHLACFAEYFSSCESILFRLAQVETEVRIANNSTNTWREMFLPMLANTELPFLPRLNLLSQRLQVATAATVDLILSAFYASIERHITRMSPPSVVGGRIVPDQWQPETVAELEDCRLLAAKMVLEIISTLPGKLGRRAANSVMDEAAKFLAYGIVDELRYAIQPYLDEDAAKRRFLVTLEEWLTWHERQSANDSLPPWFDLVQTWRDKLAPATLEERIKDLTARDYWSVYRVNRKLMPESDPGEVYSKLSLEILEQPAVVQEMFLWFVSPEAVSAGSLLYQLGVNDSAPTLLTTVLEWFHISAATNIVANYLKGFRHRTGQLPSPSSELIDQLVPKRLDDAVQITLLADFSERGLRRLISVLPRLEGTQRAMLRQLSYDPWKELLSIADKVTFVEQFCEWADAGDPFAAHIALDITVMWRHGASSGISAELTHALIRLVKLATNSLSNIDDYHWKETLEAIAQEAPQEAAELLAEEISSVESHQFQRRSYAEEVFRALAKNYPDIAMRAIGKWIMDDRHGVIFRMFEFRGLFDAIGLTTVRPWVEQNGEVAAIRIARHLDGPRVENDLPIIPELADWLLSSFANVKDVFHEFAMGRHSGVARWGNAKDREPELETFLNHFESSPQEWVRQWIQYERQSHMHEVKRDARIEEEDDRI